MPRKPKTEAQKKVHCLYQQEYRLRKLQDGENVPARYYTPKKQYNALAKFAEKTGNSIEFVTNELLAAGLKAQGYKF